MTSEFHLGKSGTEPGIYCASFTLSAIEPWTFQVKSCLTKLLTSKNCTDVEYETDENRSNFCKNIDDMKHESNHIAKHCRIFFLRG